jgi:hypothetical protein
MIPAAAPLDGVFYTPEQVYENGWLPLTPTAIRKAAGRDEIPHTRVRGRIGLTKANIDAILAAGQHEPKDVPKPSASRRGRRVVAPVVDLPATDLPLTPKPARRRRAS